MFILEKVVETDSKKKNSSTTTCIEVHRSRLDQKISLGFKGYVFSLVESPIFVSFDVVSWLNSESHSC